MLSAIKIRNGMEKTSLINHILYSSGSSNNNTTRAGASTIIEIYKTAGLVQETDGKVISIDEEEIMSEKLSSDMSSMTNSSGQTITASGTSIQVPSKHPDSKIVININISVNVDEIDVLSEKIKALMSNLNQ